MNNAVLEFANNSLVSKRALAQLEARFIEMLVRRAHVAAPAALGTRGWLDYRLLRKEDWIVLQILVEARTSLRRSLLEFQSQLAASAPTLQIDLPTIELAPYLQPQTR
jgi:hypothetical protein